MQLNIKPDSREGPHLIITNSGITHILFAGYPTIGSLLINLKKKLLFHYSIAIYYYYTDLHLMHLMS